VKHITFAVICGLTVSLLALWVGSVHTPVAKASGGGNVNRCGGGKIFLNNKEKRTFSLHNQVRRRHNLKPFCVHPALQRAARAHSKDMIRRDYFSHDTKGRHEKACERIRRYGYHYRYCGENIGYDSDPSRMFHAWMRSAAHRHNILNGRFREVGVGAYTGRYGHYRTTMHTVDFGRR
jgi:uncharacterized protein YkwD